MECVKIRSNLCSAIERHFERIKSDEEADRLRREAEWKKVREEREAREAAWKAKYPNLSKYTYCSSYSDSGYSPYYGGFCKIHFYEWSDINSTPRVFEYYAPFYRFLDECGLWLTEEQNSKIKPLNKCYVTCKSGRKELVVAATYEELVEAFNKPVIKVSI